MSIVRSAHRGRDALALALLLLQFASSLAALSCSPVETLGPRHELRSEEGIGGVPPVTVGIGAGGGQGGAAQSSSVAAGGAGGMACADYGEPNDTDVMAKNEGSISDCDSDGNFIEAALDGSGDVDWYSYAGSDNFGCVVDPARTITASGSLRLCKLAKCVFGATAVTCRDGSTPAQSPPTNWQGCCHVQGFRIDVNCTGQDDDADILLRVDQPGASCVTYKLDYHY